MNKKTLKRQKDLKTKLMAAISMLLVSSLMMVTSTYAWFTLSTAPEVTGITTAVGANGNLEMALLPTTGDVNDITSEVGDSIYSGNQEIQEANVTWGNLVKLDEGYGLDKITLYPSALNVENDIINSEFILKTPTYGADGRIKELRGNTQTGIYANGNFLPDAASETQYGVRAIGTASGLSERELSYRTSRAALLSIASSVRTDATKALTDNGKALANVVIKYADAKAAATFTNDELTSIGTLLTALDNMMEQLDTAYMNAVMALVASGNGGESALSDGEVKAAQLLFDSADGFDDFITKLYGEDNANKASIDEMLETAGLVKSDGTGLVDQYKATASDISQAQTRYNELTTGENAERDKTWEEVVSVLEKIADPDAMLINGNPKDQVDKDALVGAVAGGEGITITIQPGGGAFADIADHAGDYRAKVSVGGITVQGITLPDNMSAWMVTAAEREGHPTYYLNAFHGVLTNPPAAESGAMPITDFYGYIVDLAFRTNAAESKLLLQVDAADRIYGDNSNEETAGHGSNMTFSADSPDFSNDSIKNLMKSIKIVFFNTNTREIVANAALDADNAVVTEDGLRADIHIIDAELAKTFAVTTGEGEDAVTTYYYGSQTTDNGVVTTIYTDSVGEKLYKVVYTPAVEGETPSDATTVYYKWVAAAEDDSTEAAFVETTDETEIASLEASKVTYSPSTSGEEIMDLSQNAAVALSVLVYLDGNTVTNKDVAYSSDKSMTGKLNLQFASSATLTAMDYKELHQATPASGSEGSGEGN